MVSYSGPEGEMERTFKWCSIQRSIDFSKLFHAA